MIDLFSQLMPSLVAGGAAAIASWAIMRTEIKFLSKSLTHAFKRIEVLEHIRENHERRITIIEVKQDGTISHRC